MKINLQKIEKMFTRKKIIILLIIIAVGISGFFAFSYVSNNKKTIAVASFSVLGKVSKFLPISQDEKKELSVVNTIVDSVMKNDNQERAYLVLLQNSAELRPGGGFLGQYAIIKIKNGKIEI